MTQEFSCWLGRFVLFLFSFSSCHVRVSVNTFIECKLHNKAIPERNAIILQQFLHYILHGSIEFSQVPTTTSTTHPEENAQRAMIELST